MATEIDFKDNHEIPRTLKRAMTTAALFTNMFRKYLEQNRCEYVNDEDEQKQFSAQLLYHVFVVGGLCRDILLKRPVNGIEIMIDVRELAKLQVSHLKKYHSQSSQQGRNCRCVFWQRYLNRFHVDDAFSREQSALPEMERVHNLNHLLNAKFWIGILRADKSLKNKLSVRDFPRNGYHSVQIVGSVEYGGIDCDDQRIDIIDTFHADQALHCDETSTDSKLAEEFHRKSRQLSKAGLDITRAAASGVGCAGAINVAIAVNDLKFDEVPIYAGKVRDKLINVDFSINTCILRLRNITRMKEHNTEHANSNKERMTWRDIIQDGLDHGNIQDVLRDKMLHWPEFGCSSILAHPPSYVFWRIVRWKIACPDFKMGYNLELMVQEDFGKWLTPDWFARPENRHRFMAYLQHTLERDCVTISDVRQMLSVMAELDFIPLFAWVAAQSPEVRRETSQCIHDCDIPSFDGVRNFTCTEMCEAFQEHGLAMLTGDDEIELHNAQRTGEMDPVPCYLNTESGPGFDDDGKISMDTKRAIATAALMTNIYSSYYEQNRCEFATVDDEYSSTAILEHVMIVGGFCRDLLLDRPVNDINILIDLSALTKLQRKHILKYHSQPATQDTYCRCVFWQRYLHKLTKVADAATVSDTAALSKTMHTANHIFNTRFWIGLLLADERLKNKVVVRDSPDKGYVSAQIVGSVMFGGIDCNGQRFDFVDTFEQPDAFHKDVAWLSMKHDIQSRHPSAACIERLCEPTLDDANWQEHLAAAVFDRHQSTPSAAVLPKKHGRSIERIELVDVLLCGFVRSASMPSDILSVLMSFARLSLLGAVLQTKRLAIASPVTAIPIRFHSLFTHYKLLQFDFSINTCILPLSKIAVRQRNNMNSKWIDLIENGAGERYCDSIADCLSTKILRSPLHQHYLSRYNADPSTAVHPRGYVFWRIVRWLISEREWRIADPLIKAQMADFGKWVTLEWFAKNENTATFMDELQQTLECDCRTIDDVEQMLHTMHELGFTQTFARVLQQSVAVRRALMRTICACDNANLTRNAIEQSFAEWGLTLSSDDELELEQCELTEKDL